MDDPIRDAEIHYLHIDKQDAKFRELYEHNLTDLSVFQSFIHDIDSEAPEIKLLFDQMNGDEMDKVYAYDNLIILYEKYVEELTEMT